MGLENERASEEPLEGQLHVHKAIATNQLIRNAPALCGGGVIASASHDLASACLCILPRIVIRTRLPRPEAETGVHWGTLFRRL
jgi:hypothetical protein